MQEFHPVLSIPVVVFSVPIDALLISTSPNGPYCLPYGASQPRDITQLSVVEDRAHSVRYITCKQGWPGAGIGPGDYAEAGVGIGIVAKNTELSYGDGYHAVQVDVGGRLPATPTVIDKLDPEPWLAIAGNRLDLSATGFREDMTRIYPNDAQEDGQHQVTRSITSESAQQQPSNIYVEWRNKPSRWGLPTATAALLAGLCIFGFGNEFAASASSATRQLTLWLTPLVGLSALTLTAVVAQSSTIRPIIVCAIDVASLIAITIALRWPSTPSVRAMQPSRRGRC